MKKTISFLAAIMVCLVALAQGKTHPADWADGKTPYVVSFWFINCKYCLEEMDAIAEVFQEWTAQTPFRFIGVCTDDSRSVARAKALVKSRGWDDFEFVYDTNREIARTMNVTSCPYVLLYDKNGRLVYSHLGYTPGDEDVLFQKIKALP
jgi:thioredoxin-related protein